MAKKRLSILSVIVISIISTTIPMNTYAQGTGIMGDVNADGSVDIVDALMTAQYGVGLNPDMFLGVADANTNRVIDIVDALLIAQYYVGLVSQLPQPAGTGENNPIPRPVYPPENFVYQGGLSTSLGSRANWANSVVEGNYLYIMAQPYLKIFDITDINNPLFIKDIMFFEDDFYISLIRRGDFIFVQDMEDIWYLLDTTDPENPIKVLVTNNSVFPGIIIVGNYGYAPGETSIDIIDISDPLAFQLITSVDIGFQPEDMVAKDGLLVLQRAFSVRNLSVFDITDPLSPVLASEIIIESSWDHGLYNNHVYSFNQTTLSIYDVTLPTAPILVSTLDIGSNPFTFHNNYLFIHSGTIMKIDISDPSAPVIVSETPHLYSSDHMLRFDNYMVFLDNSRTDGSFFSLYDLGDSDAPLLVSELDALSNNPQSVSVKGDYIYLANGSRGLKIIDISVPANPQVLSSLQTTHANHSVLLEDVLYLTDGSGGLKVIDTSQPDAPNIVKSISMSFSADKLLIEGTRLFVTGIFYMDIYDISDPYNPSKYCTFTRYLTHDYYASTCNELAVKGDYAYVASTYYGGRADLVDISDPAAPFDVVEFSSNQVCAVALQWDFLFLARGTNPANQLFSVYDISDPINPIVRGGLRMVEGGEFGNSFFLSPRYTFVGCGAGVVVSDTSYPRVPFYLGCISLEYNDIRDVAATDTHLFIVNGSAEEYLVIYRIE